MDAPNIALKPSPNAPASAHRAKAHSSRSPDFMGHIDVEFEGLTYRVKAGTIGQLDKLLASDLKGSDWLITMIIQNTVGVENGTEVGRVWDEIHRSELKQWPTHDPLFLALKAAVEKLTSMSMQKEAAKNG